MREIIVDKADVLLAVCKEWKKVPELRFMQLIVNLQDFYGKDMFYTEDSDFIENLKQFVEKITGKFD